MRSGVAVSLGLLLTVQAAVGQSPELLSRIDAATQQAVTPVLAAAERDSLPTDALESKVLEGVAKRVPPERIGQALSQLADQLREVRTGLRRLLPFESFSDEEIVAAARAARVGVPVEQLDDLWAARPDGAPLEVAVTVLGELVRRGIPAAEASRVMAHVVRTGVPMRTAAQIPGRFDGALANAGTPVDALTQALRVLEIPNPPGRRPGG